MDLEGREEYKQNNNKRLRSQLSEISDIDD